jgi:hypothetical protein
MDFAVANGMTDEIWVYLGNGDGTFQLPLITLLTKGVSPIYLQTADLRGNGTLDLIVAEFDSSSVGILFGNGDGTFGIEQELAYLPQAPAALVVDDFNHDGKPDITVVMVNRQSAGPYFATFFGDGTGSFSGPYFTYNSLDSFPWNIASGDVNGDGLPDLIVAGPDNTNAQVYLNNGNGTFTAGPDRQIQRHLR